MQDAPVATQATPDVQAALAELARLFDSFCPAEGGTIEDVAGNEYRLPRALSARTEVEALRHVRTLFSLPAVDSVAQDLLASQRSPGDLSAALASAMGAMASPEVMDAVDGVFAAAFPGVLAQAQAAATPQQGDDVPTRATDLFSLEDVVAALLPFCARAMRKVLGNRKSPATTTT